MLDPRPGRTINKIRQKPSALSRVISKKNLRIAWDDSRDSTLDAGRAGIDNQSPASFGANLDRSIEKIADEIKRGHFGFSPLKAALIPKADSDKSRLICIPTVRDRLVQKTIVAHLNKTKRLPIYDPFSFGFIPGNDRGTKKAIEKVIELRAKYDWCLKTDIESFFDRIPREYLKVRIKTAMRGHSLTNLICKAVDCEIHERPDQKAELEKLKIERKRGVRQGMPLSPILSNLALSEFDGEIRKRRLVMVRYADDLIFFFKTEDELLRGESIVRSALDKIRLTIPVGGKTQPIKPRCEVEFLGREIFYSEKLGYLNRISSRQIKKIKERMAEEYSYEKLRSKKINLQDAIVQISRSVSSYLGMYKDAHNFQNFDRELRTTYRAILSEIFAKIFGKESLEKLNESDRDFLGIGYLNIPPPVDDLES